MAVTNSDGVYRNLGANISQNMSIEDQLEAAGLNWRVRISRARFGDCFQFVSRPQDKSALYRPDSGIIMDYVGTEWEPVQNRDLVEAINEFALLGGGEIERLGFLDEGRVVFAGLKFRNIEVTKENRRVGDIVSQRLIVTNYHQQNKALKVTGFNTRLICTNGMTESVNLRGVKLTHRNLFESEKVKLVLEAAIQGFDIYAQNAALLANIRIEKEQAIAALLATFGKRGMNGLTLPLDEQPAKIHEAIALFQGVAMGAQLETARNTAWGLLNAWTQLENHPTRLRTSVDNFMQDLWWGQRANNQNKLMNSLVRAYTPAHQRQGNQPVAVGAGF